MSQMAYKPWLELKRLNRATRVDYDRLKRSTSRHKGTGSIEYVSLIGLQNRTLQVSGVLARFRDIDFNGYRHCVNPNTPIEAIRNPGRQHQSRDVKVGNNPTARTLRLATPLARRNSPKSKNFSAASERKSKSTQSSKAVYGLTTESSKTLGELAAHSSPLERKGNQGHRSQGKDVSKQQPTIIRPETTEPQYNTSNTFNLAILPENAVPHSLQKGPQKCGDSLEFGWALGSVGGNSEGALIQTPPNPTDLVEFGGARGIGRGKQSDPPRQKRKRNLIVTSKAL
ncbi:hypothetical protein R3P38DRAFT_2764042 [Favolaschia claudopus]|uniref:Uncharacterized protein n=1 Tax=Favolaschia claudopus TaxID=2862362 RepID=A0AAW0DE67_9AGAR